MDVHLGFPGDPAAHNNHDIIMASETGHVDVVKALLHDKRVDPTTSHNFALRWASFFGRIKVIELLLEDGRVEVPNAAIGNAATKEIKEMLIRYKNIVE
jgi:hypothetical protein